MAKTRLPLHWVSAAGRPTEATRVDGVRVTLATGGTFDLVIQWCVHIPTPRQTGSDGGFRSSEHTVSLQGVPTLRKMMQIVDAQWPLPDWVEIESGWSMDPLEQLALAGTGTEGAK